MLRVIMTFIKLWFKYFLLMTIVPLLVGGVYWFVSNDKIPLLIVLMIIILPTFVSYIELKDRNKWRD